ncbi:MAG: hypothetical protein ACXVP5_01325 [Tumebacillaceae bacterium]
MFRFLVGMLLCVGLLGGNLQAVHATQPGKAPVTTFSTDWAITFTGHHFTISNKGQLVNDVTVELYRPMVNKDNHSMVMVAGPIKEDIMKHGQTVRVGHVPVIDNAGVVEFVITWKIDGRKYRQSLSFKQEELM